jgi:hypothetical protein
MEAEREFRDGAAGLTNNKLAHVDHCLFNVASK